MSMGEEILVLLKEAGTHQTSAELMKRAGNVFKASSFNVTLYDMAVKKKTIKRFDLRYVGGEFVYGLLGWPAPANAPKPVPVKQEPIAQVELRERLGNRAVAHPLKPESQLPLPPSPDSPEFGIDWGPSHIRPDKPPEKPMAPPVASDEEIEQEPVLPLIDAIDLGIYRIRGTDLLIQVKQDGVKAYRLGE